MLSILRKVISDCLTSAYGDFDPARVVGYLIAAGGGIEFLALEAYATVRNGNFDGVQFAAGLSGVAAVIAGAAAGVWIKRSSEIQPQG